MKNTTTRKKNLLVLCNKIKYGTISFIIDWPIISTTKLCLISKSINISKTLDMVILSKLMYNV